MERGFKKVEENCLWSRDFYGTPKAMSLFFSPKPKYTDPQS